MKHSASSSFWTSCRALPESLQRLADRCYETLKRDPHHPSLHLKQVGSYWSVRVGLHYRALGVTAPDGIAWFWIGSHAAYDKLIRG